MDLVKFIYDVLSSSYYKEWLQNQSLFNNVLDEPFIVSNEELEQYGIKYISFKLLRLKDKITIEDLWVEVHVNSSYFEHQNELILYNDSRYFFNLLELYIFIYLDEIITQSKCLYFNFLPILGYSFYIINTNLDNLFILVDNNLNVFSYNHVTCGCCIQNDTYLMSNNIYTTKKCDLSKCVIKVLN